MADAAQIGANASSYTGDPGLGGGSFGFGRLDTRPLEDLARYTFLYNKAEYDQRQRDAEAAAKEIADATSYDLTTSIPKDAKLLQEKYDKLISYMREHPEAINYRDKEAWAKYKTMRNDLDNDLQSAKVRDLMNKAREKEIADETVPELKAYLKNNLTKEIDSTDIRTPLKLTSKYDIAPVNVPQAPIKEVHVTEIGKNVIGFDTWRLPDMELLSNMATTIETGITNLADFESQQFFKDLSPEEQELRRQQFLAQQASGKLRHSKSVEYFNAAVKGIPPQYYTTDSAGNKVLNLEKLKEYDNPIVRGVVEQTQFYNEQMAQMRNAIRNGWFKDKFGNELHFGTDASGLKEVDYRDININDGLSAGELIKLEMLAKTPTPTREIKIQETGFDLARQRIGVQLAQLGVDRARYNLEAAKFNAAIRGQEEEKTAIKAFVDNLYSSLADKASVKGTQPNGERGFVLTPNDIKKLTQEELKYLGVERPPVRNTTTGEIEQSGGLNPLTLAEDDIIELHEDGSIRVMSKARFDEKSNKWLGTWNKEKSTSTWNAGINRLNEENIKSGSKERNAYVPLDLRGGHGTIQVDKSGGGVSVSGSTKTVTRYPLPKGQPAEVIQNGYRFKWNEETGKYE